MNWRKEAECRGVDTSVFHPEHGQPDVARNAKDICSRCSVRHDCLEFALQNDERHGIWGGMSPGERRQELARRKR